MRNNDHNGVLLVVKCAIINSLGVGGVAYVVSAVIRGDTIIAKHRVTASVNDK